MVITSLQNPKVKATARLRDGRARRRQGLFLIDGLREIERAAERQIAIKTAFFCPERYVRTEQAEAILKRFDKNKTELLEVDAAVFDKIAFGDRAEGILAVAETPDRSLASFTLPTETQTAPSPKSPARH